MKRIAVVTTIYRYLSHAQHFADRFLVGYPRQGKWHRPDMKVVSLYVDQKPEGDQSTDRAREFGFSVYPTIAEALRCGGDKIAVDAVLLIGEHGDYPHNEKSQVLYPRYEFFKECVKVLRQMDVLSLSSTTNTSPTVLRKRRRWWTMHTDSVLVCLQVRLYLSHGGCPDVELPLECEIEEALMVGVGGSDPMDYHALEAMQCMVERRKGGENRCRRCAINRWRGSLESM